MTEYYLPQKNSGDIWIKQVNVHVYQVRQKSNPLKSFSVFSATAWNLSVTT